MSDVDGLRQSAGRLWEGAKRVWDRSGRLIAFLLFFAALFFGGSWLMLTLVQGVEPVPRAAIATQDGRDIAVVAYEQMGPRGMLQMMTGGFALTRVTALDVATGDLEWDVTVGSSDTYDVRIVGAGAEYVYVSAADGLWVLSLDDGGVVAQPGEITGLDDPMEGAWAYDIDQERGVIVAIDVDEDIYSIPLDTVTAERADEGLLAEWRPILAESFRFADDADATADEVFTRDDQLISASDDGLGRYIPDEGRIRVSDARFIDPALVVDSMSRERRARLGEESPYDTEAFGAVGDGYVVVADHDGDGGAPTIVTVDLDTGEVVSTVDGWTDTAGGTTGAGGSSVIVGGNMFLSEDTFFSAAGVKVVLVAPDGTAITATIGRLGFFGEPL